MHKTMVLKLRLRGEQGDVVDMGWIFIKMRRGGKRHRNFPGLRHSVGVVVLFCELNWCTLKIWKYLKTLTGTHCLRDWFF